MSIGLQLIRCEFKVDTARLVCGDPSAGSVEGNIHHCSKSQAKVVNHAQRRVPRTLPRRISEACVGARVDVGKIVLLMMSMCGTRDAASNGERDWQEHIESW